MLGRGVWLALCVLLAAAALAHAGCGRHLARAESSVKTTTKGGECGAGIAVCPASQCCSQYGRCQEKCSTTCQCSYSGKESSCNGTMAFTEVGVPIAPSAGVCGRGVGICPKGECCSQYGFCGTNKASCDAGCDALTSGPNSSCESMKEGTVRYDLSLDWKEMAPDGFPRQTITINGQMPGPTIRCKQGDRLIIRVKNNLKQPASIHWHGILQRGTVIMDGVAGVTQRAIPESTSQLYNFICDLPGTFWYHSHFKSQYIDGLKGALIVEPHNAPAVKPAAESIVQLSDWYHEDSEELSKIYLSPASKGDEPVPMSALINGVGQGNCTGSKCRYLAFPAVPGTCQQGRTKLRIINTSGFALFTLYIDGHSMVVTALDALPITPSKPLKAIRINAGQRYDVSVCADSAKFVGKPAWIRADMLQSVFPSDSPDPLVLGVLQYAPPGAPVKQLPTTTKESWALDELLSGFDVGAVDPYEFEPLSRASPPAATRKVYLNMSFYDTPAVNGTNWGHFNNISMQTPDGGGPLAPSMLEKSFAGTLPANKNFGYHTITVQEGDVVDMVINNLGGGQHPMHLHGHWMWIMARGQPKDGLFDPVKTPLSKTPVLRDTVTINLKSYAVLRFVADNPGAWIFHCHIDWHLEAGLALVFQYGLK